MLRLSLNVSLNLKFMWYRTSADKFDADTDAGYPERRSASAVHRWDHQRRPAATPVSARGDTERQWRRPTKCLTK